MWPRQICRDTRRVHYAISGTRAGRQQIVTRSWKSIGRDGDPCVTYERGECEVAVFTCVCGDHLHLESAWIEELSPRDNLVEHPDGLEDAPF